MAQSSNDKTKLDGAVNYFLHLGQAKRTFRTGWILRGVHDAESIADHMYRMSMMAFLAPDHLDRNKCIKMCLVHDVAECIVGDLTPDDKVSKEEKAKREQSAMADLTEMVRDSNSSASDHLKTLFDEYSLHESPEANFVKSLDLLDMYIQAYEYEQIQKVDLSEFFSQVPKNLNESSSFDPLVKKWLQNLMDIRAERQNVLPMDSNFNTVLKNILKR